MPSRIAYPVISRDWRGFNAICDACRMSHAVDRVGLDQVCGRIETGAPGGGELTDSHTTICAHESATHFARTGRLRRGDRWFGNTGGSLNTFLFSWAFLGHLLSLRL